MTQNILTTARFNPFVVDLSDEQIEALVHFRTASRRARSARSHRSCVRPSRAVDFRSYDLATAVANRRADRIDRLTRRKHVPVLRNSEFALTPEGEKVLGPDYRLTAQRECGSYLQSFLS